MRGLAALQVFFSHCLNVHQPFSDATARAPIQSGLVQILTYSPLHLFWAGGQAVIFFFVLSGFVLALPYFEDRGLSYGPFLTRRVFRIYFPYLAVVLLSAFLIPLSLPMHPLTGISEGWTHKWEHEVGWGGYLRLALMSGDLTNVDAPAWSLVYEMRISILFPLICWIVRRIGFGWILAAEALLALFVPHCQGPFLVRLASTLNYSFYFFLGCWVAKNRGGLVEKCSRIAPWGKVVLLVMALNLYVLPWELPVLYDVLRTPNPDIRHSDLVTGLAACLLIVLALASPWLREWLGQKPLLWLGRVSYSFYLTHVVVLLSALYFLPSSWSFLIREAIGGVACFFVAGLSYRILESPFHNLGKNLAGRLEGAHPGNAARWAG